MRFSTMRATCLTLLPHHPYSTQPQLQIFKLLVMHFLQPPVISYVVFYTKTKRKKKNNVIMQECLKLGWKCIFTHVTNVQRLSEKAFIF
jgi:hypothetical protein